MLRFQFLGRTLDHLRPARPEVAAHCDRVAALAGAVGRRLALPARSLEVLQQAAGLHHAPALVLNAAALTRLLADLLPSAPQPQPPKRGGFWSRSPERLESALRTFSGIPPVSGDSTVRILAEVLTLSDILDQELRPPILEPVSTPEIWSGLDELRGWISAPVLEATHWALDAPFRLSATARWELSPQALVAKEVFCTLAANRECDVQVLAGLAGRDPVMAGKLIESANSALYTRQVPVSSIPQAISYIGTEATRKALLALALQRLSASAQGAQLWRHSVWMAQYCETLAADHGLAPPDEALLAGLVHDIGHMALATLPREAAATHARLIEEGCPPAYAEQLLFGCDHAEIGAGVLRAWRFPDHLVEAVRFHHQPADSSSDLASVLYLAEYWSETDEDVQMQRHWKAAVERTRLSLEELARSQHRDVSLDRVLNVA